MLAFLFIELCIPAYLIVQVLLVRRWRGGWRIAAMAALVLGVPATGWTLLAFIAQSNLWPLPLLFFAPLGLGYLLMLMLARWQFGKLREAST